MAGKRAQLNARERRSLKRVRKYIRANFDRESDMRKYKADHKRNRIMRMRPEEYEAYTKRRKIERQRRIERGIPPARA